MWILLTLWVLIGIYAFYLEVRRTTKNQMQDYYDNSKLELLSIFVIYCIIGIVVLLFSWLEDKEEF